MQIREEKVNKFILFCRHDFDNKVSPRQIDLSFFVDFWQISLSVFLIDKQVLKLCDVTDRVQ